MDRKNGVEIVCAALKPHLVLHRQGAENSKAEMFKGKLVKGQNTNCMIGVLVMNYYGIIKKIKQVTEYKKEKEVLEMTKIFELVKATARKIEDLRCYDMEIRNAYYEVNPRVQVSVYERYYIVDGELESSQARNAGRIIAQTGLGRHSIRYPKYGAIKSVHLFKSKKYN